MFFQKGVILLLMCFALGTVQQVEQDSAQSDYNGEHESRITEENKRLHSHTEDSGNLAASSSYNEIKEEGHCQVEAGGQECPPSNHEKYLNSKQEEELDEEKESLPSKLYHRSMEGLGEMLGQVEKSKAKVLERLEGVMDQVAHSKDQMMKGFDNVMDKMSESKVRVIKSFDRVMDKVSASKSLVMEEIDYVIEEIRALPGEIRESFVLSVRNRSYIAAGIMVAVTAAILIGGAVYFAWCHHDAWSYHRVPLEELNHLSDEDAASVIQAQALVNGTTLSAESSNKTMSNGKTAHKRNLQGSENGGSKDTYNRPVNGVKAGSTDETPESQTADARNKAKSQQLSTAHGADVPEELRAAVPSQSLNKCDNSLDELDHSTKTSDSSADECKLSQESLRSSAIGKKNSSLVCSLDNNVAKLAAPPSPPDLSMQQESAELLKKTDQELDLDSKLRVQDLQKSRVEELGAGDDQRSTLKHKHRYTRGEGDHEQQSHPGKSGGETQDNSM